MFKRKSIFIPTPDDWYPTFDDGTVRCSFVKLSDGNYRISVWGNDDFGLEKDSADLTTMRLLWRKISKMAIITQQQLYDLGFINA